MRIGSVIACAAIAPLLIAASQPLRLQPASPWDLDYAADSCRLIRNFGEGKNTVKLAFESEAPGRLDMLALGKPLGFGIDTDEVPARFLPLERKPFTGRTAKAADNGDPAILWSTVKLLPDDVVATLEKEDKAREAKKGERPPAIDLAEKARLKAYRADFATKTNEIEIQVSRSRPVILETGTLGEAIRLFDQCSRDSLRDWGVDPDLEDKIVRPVWAPKISSWFSASDYPREMITSGVQSEVKFRLLVDASGRVTKCTSLTHFSEPEFSKIVCDRIMKRASFEPAELADGTKVPSYYVNRVVFRIAP